MKSLLQRLGVGQDETPDPPASRTPPPQTPTVDAIQLRTGPRVGLGDGSMTGRQTETEAPASASEPKSTEQRLFEAMDETAEYLLTRLKNIEVDPETQAPLVTDRQKEATFRLVMDWLAKSKRLRPEDANEEPIGVATMRQVIREAKATKAPRHPSHRPLKPPSDEGSALAKAVEAKAKGKK